MLKLSFWSVQVHWLNEVMSDVHRCNWEQNYSHSVLNMHQWNQEGCKSGCYIDQYTNWHKLQVLLYESSKKAKLIDLPLCKSCLGVFLVWNKSVWNWGKLSEFILNPAHSLCAICEWSMRIRHHRKWTYISHVCSSHLLLWCPAIADWFEMWSAGGVHLARSSQEERDPLVGCELPLESHRLWTPASLGSCGRANTH